MNNKVKAAIICGAITTIIIAETVTITLWPTQKDNNQTHGDNGDHGDHRDGDMTDSAKFNLVNLHFNEHYGRLWMPNSNNNFCKGLCLAAKEEKKGEKREVEGEGEEHPQQGLRHQRHVVHGHVDASSPSVGPPPASRTAPPWGPPPPTRAAPTTRSPRPERRRTTRARPSSCSCSKNKQ